MASGNFIKYSLLFLLFCISQINIVFGQSIAHSYVIKYQSLAISMMRESGIPASIILSIAITESAAGTSRNARLLNNHFGIKSQKKNRIPGTKHITAYRTYISDTLSYKGFCEWISKRSFYQALCENKDYRLWIKTLGVSGYARSHSAWRKKILTIIDYYCLSDLDCLL